MEVILRNPNSNAREVIEVGWSWKLFTFSLFFGLPLFLLKIRKWGLIMASLVSAYLIPLFIFPILIYTRTGSVGMFFAPSHPEMMTIMMYVNRWSIAVLVVMMTCATFLSFKGSKIAGRKFLDDGWVFAEPEAWATKLAKSKWNTTD